jgi:hypothetical protein
MAAPTKPADVKKSLANPEPSTHGPSPEPAQGLLARVNSCDRTMIAMPAGKEVVDMARSVMLVFATADQWDAP